MKRRIHPDKVSAETWQEIGRWLADRIGEMEPDAACVSEESGPEFLPALRGLADHIAKGKRP